MQSSLPIRAVRLRCGSRIPPGGRISVSGIREWVSAPISCRTCLKDSGRPAVLRPACTAASVSGLRSSAISWNATAARFALKAAPKAMAHRSLSIFHIRERGSMSKPTVLAMKSYSVRNPAGEDLGKLEDLVIDENGRVLYGVLSYGGLLHVGGKLVAVPWRRLQLEG